jgi:formylmethanofuran dehydrogenase subunit E
MHIGPYSFDEFKAMAAAFHGYPAPGLLIGGYMVERAKAALPEGTLFEAIVETKKCLPDAVQLLTLCSTGNGWMKVINLGRYAVTLYDKYTGVGTRVHVHVPALDAWPHIRGWFLKQTPKAQQDTEALFREIEAAGDSILMQQPVTVPKRFLGHRSMSAIAICPVCAEAYPANDGAVCRGCQGEAPYLEAGPETVQLQAVPLAEAVGKRVLHDMTQIIPGKVKGPAFRAGQEITAGDICRLQQMGRMHVYVEESAPAAAVHENEAVRAFAARMAGPGVRVSDSPKEGRLDFFASHPGLLWVDRQRLVAFNLVPQVMCATRQSGSVVEAGRILGGTRAIPLYLSRDLFQRALAALGEGPLLAVRPLRPARVGILVTGTEVFQGLIEDRFAPIVRGKVEALGSHVVAVRFAPDQRTAIAAAVAELVDAGADLIITTAGLSVDPDDVTLPGLMDAGLTDVLHGAPLLPGAMTLIGRVGDVQVLGVPACALFFKTTSLDVLLPRLLAGVPITRQDLAQMAEGGICLGCDICTYPKCPFAK